MLLGPIFPVELVTSARRARYYLVRVGFALVLLLSLCIVYANTVANSGYASVTREANVAGQYFAAFAWLVLSAVLLLGPAMVVGAISVERERRTIEYLLATDLSNAEIVLAKLCARALSIIYLLLVGLPILAMAMLMGGIAPAELAISFVVTASSLVSVATLSIAVSVWAPRVRDAIVRVYVILFALVFLPWMFGLIAGTGVGWLNALHAFFQEANPLSVLGTAFSVRRNGLNALGLWGPVGTMVRDQLVFSVLTAASATWAVRRVHLAAADRAPKPTKTSKRDGRGARRGPGNQPMIWKEMHAAAATRLGIVARGAMLAIGLSVLSIFAWWTNDEWSRNGALSYWSMPVAVPLVVSCVGVLLIAAGAFLRRRALVRIAMALAGAVILIEYAAASAAWDAAPQYFDFVAPIVMPALIGCGGLLLVAARAGGSVAAEKDKDTWLTLLSTPLEPREIVLGKIIGSLCVFRPVGVIIAIMWAVTWLRFPTFIVPILFTAATLGSLVLFAAALGTLFSLKAKNSARAIAATLATMLIVGGGYSVCCVFAVDSLARSGNRDDFMVVAFSPCMPFLLCMPGIAYIDWGRMSARHDAAELVAYGIGTAGYCVAAMVLMAVTVRHFNFWAGRQEGRAFAPGPYRRTRPAVKSNDMPTLELVDE